MTANHDTFVDILTLYNYYAKQGVTSVITSDGYLIETFYFFFCCSCSHCCYIYYRHYVFLLVYTSFTCHGEDKIHWKTLTNANWLAPVLTSLCISGWPIKEHNFLIRNHVVANNFTTILSSMCTYVDAEMSAQNRDIITEWDKYC